MLNRVTAERNLFDRVVNLRLPGESTLCLSLENVLGREGWLVLKSSTELDGIRPQTCPALPVTQWQKLLPFSFASTGLESVDHYPILVAVTGILVRLLVDTDVQG